MEIVRRRCNSPTDDALFLGVDIIIVQRQVFSSLGNSRHFPVPVCREKSTLSFPSSLAAPRVKSYRGHFLSLTPLTPPSAVSSRSHSG